MSVGLVVELERLVAEASLCRGQLEELGQLLASYRQRVRDGLAQAGVTHEGVPVAPEALAPPPDFAQAALAPEMDIEELPAPPAPSASAGSTDDVVPDASAPVPAPGWGTGGA